MKTKQEEIGEGMRDMVKYHSGFTLADQSIRQILQLLHSQGVVIKVDKKLPPVKEDYPFERLDEQVIMLKAGYVATEPLIKEEL